MQIRWEMSFVKRNQERNKGKKSSQPMPCHAKTTNRMTERIQRMSRPRRLRLAALSKAIKKDQRNTVTATALLFFSVLSLFPIHFTPPPSLHLIKISRQKGTWWTMPSLSVYGWLLFKILIKKVREGAFVALQVLNWMSFFANNHNEMAIKMKK